MPEKDEPENPFFEFVKNLWLPIAGFIGAVLLIYQLVQIWNGDKQTITWIIALVGLVIWLIFLGWVGFSKSTSSRQAHRHGHEHDSERHQTYHPFWQWTARIVLIITVVLLAAAWFYKQYQQQQVAKANQNEVIVVIAQFDGPEETYGLRNQILEQLNSSLGGDKDIQIIPINQTVTIAQGSDYARQLGKQYQADLVFWGWYRPTENPNLTLHIENLSPAKFSVLQGSETYKPQASIADLQSFSVQQKLGQQTSALISFLSGFLFYQAGKYDIAITRFQQALNEPEWSNEMINQGDAYFYFANAYRAIKKYQEAIMNYDRAIQINSQFAYAYNNRGIAYDDQGQYAQAIADYTQAIQINSQDANAYNNRGNVYNEKNQFAQAIADYTQAIQINPQDADAYSNRGATYLMQGQLAQAIDDFNHAIQINPQHADAYSNRGATYLMQGQLAQAIDDFNHAIQIYPQDADTFTSRGQAYADEGQYVHAIADYTQAIQINPQLALAYYDRAVAYQNMGQQQQANADFAKYKELTGQNNPQPTPSVTP